MRSSFLSTGGKCGCVCDRWVWPCGVVLQMTFHCSRGPPFSNPRPPTTRFSTPPPNPPIHVPPGCRRRHARDAMAQKQRCPSVPLSPTKNTAPHRLWTHISFLLKSKTSAYTPEEATGTRAESLSPPPPAPFSVSVKTVRNYHTSYEPDRENSFQECLNPQGRGFGCSRRRFRKNVRLRRCGPTAGGGPLPEK